ncbi:MAG: hypothetical protein WD512_03235 [Candidatus Paceibacterota bacterium]
MSKTEWNFKIENKAEKWPKQFITGTEVRAIPPGIPDNMDLFVKRRGEVGVLVKADDRIDLGEPGIEKFYSQAVGSKAG